MRLTPIDHGLLLDCTGSPVLVSGIKFNIAIHDLLDHIFNGQVGAPSEFVSGF